MSLPQVCDVCGQIEERLWVDTWTGLQACMGCLGPVIDRITNSPASEGDNIEKLLPKEEV